MKEYTLVMTKTYVITPNVTCTVTTPDGTVITTCPPHKQTAFVAHTNRVFVSDDSALLSVSFNGASLSAPEGGKKLPPLPASALSWEAIETLFSNNAQPGSGDIPAVISAPSAVFISRVPWARLETAAGVEQWVNNASVVNETVFGVTRKLMDNAGLRHACSTDTVEGVDDYNGKRWSFYWQHANYVTDDYGIKHITAIKGTPGFSAQKNICAFGPAFWFFCCPEHSQAENGTWRTHDGTEAGTSLFQLWGISSRPWEQLDAQRRAELTALGVTEADFHLWPECRVWNEEEGQIVDRPYWCHAAYCGGYEEDADGKATLVSKPGLPLYNGMSHSKLNAFYDNRTGFGGSAAVNGFGMLFDIVKNATKNSQSIHAGLAKDLYSAVKASQSTAEPDYVFPIASRANFVRGCTVWLWQTAGSSSETTYRRSRKVQIGRIASIETRTLTLADGSSAESLCLVIDPSTVHPFVVRTGTDNTAAIAATKELTDAGTYACCFASLGMALTGETDTVLGLHDGSRYSYSDYRHAYRVQGTEYMPGIYICAADVQAVRGNGSTSVEIDGEVSTPTNRNYIIFQSCHGSSYRTGGTPEQYLESGYRPVGLAPATGGYILNARLSATGIAYPVAAGGNGSGSNTGHADNYWTGGNSAEFLMGGYLTGGAHYGSAALHLIYTPLQSYWFIGGRD